MQYQHSAIRGAKVTLPSVEGGFGSLNVLRDPPKSIHTRYKPKISDTSKLTEWIDASGDRICEAINVYARGVNPMVSVSYSNYGTNGGQVRDGGGRIGQTPLTSTARQSYLPYSVVVDGEFRPPIVPPQQMLPLSRLPRVQTSYSTNAGAKSIVSEVKDLTKCSSDLKKVRKELLQVCATPRAIFNIETPMSKPHGIEDAINIDKRYQSVEANKNNNAFYRLGINSTPERGIKTNENTLYGTVETNPYKNVQATPIHGFKGNQKISVQKRVQGSVHSNLLGRETQKYIHREQHRERNRPIASMHVNPGQRGVDMNGNINSRSYTHLPSRKPIGGIENVGFKPSSAVGKTNQPIRLSEKNIFQQAEREMSRRY